MQPANPQLAPPSPPAMFHSLPQKPEGASVLAATATATVTPTTPIPTATQIAQLPDAVGTPTLCCCHRLRRSLLVQRYSRYLMTFGLFKLLLGARCTQFDGDKFEAHTC